MFSLCVSPNLIIRVCHFNTLQWKKLDESTRELFEQRAAVEKQMYEKAMYDAVYNKTIEDLVPTATAGSPSDVAGTSIASAPSSAASASDMSTSIPGTGALPPPHPQQRSVLSDAKLPASPAKIARLGEETNTKPIESEPTWDNDERLDTKPPAAPTDVSDPYVSALAKVRYEDLLYADCTTTETDREEHPAVPQPLQLTDFHSLRDSSREGNHRLSSEAYTLSTDFMALQAAAYNSTLSPNIPFPNYAHAHPDLAAHQRRQMMQQGQAMHQQQPSEYEYPQMHHERQSSFANQLALSRDLQQHEYQTMQARPPFAGDPPKSSEAGPSDSTTTSSGEPDPSNADEKNAESADTLCDMISAGIESPDEAEMMRRLLDSYEK